jgi:hypothetical protein
MKEIMIWLNLMCASLVSIVLIGLIFIESKDNQEDIIGVSAIWVFLVCNSIVLIRDKK